MNELQIFNNEEFGSVRTVEIDGKPYFSASDVAAALRHIELNESEEKEIRKEMMKL